MQTKYTGVRFSIAFLYYLLKLSTEKKILNGQNCFTNKVSIFFFFLKVLWKKNWSYLKFAFKINICFQKSETTFSKQFCLKISLCFCIYLRDGTQKKLLKTKHQCSFVYIRNFTVFFHFGSFLVLWSLVSTVLQFFSGV